MRRTVGQVYAVDDVTFAIGDGETLGLVGESGCGKSTVARTVMRLIEPTDGAIRLDGHDVTRLGKAEMRPYRRQMQMIFQDPFSSLNPRMSAGDIVGEPLAGARHRPRRREAGAGRAIVRSGRAAALTDERLPARILGRPAPAHLDRPRFGAQPQADRRRRAGLGARRVDPGAGHQPADGPAARKAPVLPVHRPRPRGGRAHQPPIAVMYLGKIVEYADKKTLFTNPLHPYTEALLSAVPVPNPKLKREKRLLQGDVPSPINPPLRLRLPHPLPLRRGALQGGQAEARRAVSRPRRLMPPAGGLTAHSPLPRGTRREGALCSGA